MTGKAKKKYVYTTVYLLRAQGVDIYGITYCRNGWAADGGNITSRKMEYNGKFYDVLDYVYMVHDIATKLGIRPTAIRSATETPCDDAITDVELFKRLRAAREK
ncbi:MAG: hypothetical protein FWG39_02155 [Alphaproteobacteria bacterium]|nr:hypothetical protein [Alphaproteobacteria bacterium]